MTEAVPADALGPAGILLAVAMGMMRTIVLGSVLCLWTATAAQEGVPAKGVVRPVVAGARGNAQDASPGTVVVTEEPAVTTLMADYARREHVLKGFRVQVFLNADRKLAETMRAQFLQKHPDVPAYLSYQAPNFKVRVGDLLTRLEGEKLRAELKAEFPGCYIVPDEIELPRLPE